MENINRFLILFFAIITIVACKKETETNNEAITEEILPIPEPEVVEQVIEGVEVVEKSVAELKAELTREGFQIFDYVDEETKDTILMQQYYIAFLKRGPIRNQNEEEAAQLQSEHLLHLGNKVRLILYTQQEFRSSPFVKTRLPIQATRKTHTHTKQKSGYCCNKNLTPT